jgi:autotransporter-associated beta strand protein
MAIKYFDRNTTTSGFGTLTGAWDTTTASWSDSAAGTATPTAYTFTDADQAQFGATGATATAGTVTISTGINVTLNGITTQNLAARQTIARGGTGAMTLAGITPTINNASTLLITAPIGGTGGFTKSGAGALEFTTSVSTLSGTVILLGGNLYLLTTLAGTPNMLSSVTRYELTGGSMHYFGANAFTETATFSGPAEVGITTGFNCYNPAGITFSDGPSVAAFKGYWYMEAGNTAGQQAAIVLAALPATASRLWSRAFTTGTTARTNSATISGSGGTCAAVIYLEATAAGTGTVFSVADNSSTTSTWTGGALVPTGSNASATQTLELTGSNGDARMTGAMLQSASSGVMALRKAGAGKWALTGTNTYTGTTTISAGTLSVQNSSALGSASAGDVTQTGGTIEISGGINLNKGTRTFTLASVGGANALQVPGGGGDNSLTCGSIALSSTAKISVDLNTTLTLSNTGAMSGAGYGITKGGEGELILGSTANTYTGQVYASEGTLTFLNVQNAGIASSLGTGAVSPNISVGSSFGGSATLKYTGTGGSTNRTIFDYGGTTLDASGTGTITYSSYTANQIGTSSLTLRGTNTGSNTISSNIGSGQPGATVSLSKRDGGKWVLSGGTISYTGLTSVFDGTLNFGGVNRALSGDIEISGGILENDSATIESNISMTGGTIKSSLSGNKTFSITSGEGTLYPADGSTYSGTSAVSAGTILNLKTDANPATGGAGKIMGDSDVTVSGEIRTQKSLVQKGSVRFGGNLTFNGGSKMFIGGI